MILESSYKNIISFLIFFLFLVSCNTESKSYDFSGSTFGTYYKIKYYPNKNRVTIKQSELDSIFENFNNSLSTYISSSTISKINSGQNIKLDNLFQDMFNKSKILYDQTDGMFDPSIGLLLEYYGFGPDKKIISNSNFNSIMQSVGYDKLDIVDNQLIKQNTYTKLDFNAIAKGYAVDIIAELLNNKLIDNYLIDIGGEIRLKGKNLQKNQFWTVAINNPNLNSQQQFYKVLQLEDKSIATSGNYRNFRIDSITNKKYVHTLNPLNGMSEQTNILSASVVANSCFEADAFATALMAGNFDDAKKLIKKNNQIDVYLIYVNSINKVSDYYTDGFSEYFFKP